ncbi:MAG TPA: hypothetical protein VMO26_06325, partial [Vicinamibacterales bacterium]|nr:hypothetical protein [Vicinamibacterales bacterium]
MGIAGRNSHTGKAIFAAGACVAALSIGSAEPLDAQGRAPSLNEVLARAAQYVTTFHQQLSGIVAEETYVQNARTLRRGSSAVESRTSLKSDLLLIRPPDAGRYIEFRDVFEVNGTAVRDRDERLTTLFLAPTSARVDRIRAIVNESARHNIGDIPRNVNTPMLTLYFLQPDKQRQFRFRRARSGQPALGTGSAMPGRSAAMFRVTTEMWIVEFSEKERPTIIKTHRGRDFPATGRFWIDPATGAVMMSELVMENSEVTATINVSYQSEPMLGFLVPVEMRERYRARDERVDGVATYGRFRRFQV